MVGQQRIDVQFVELAAIGREPRQLGQCQGDFVEIGGGAIAITLQLATDPGAADHVAGQHHVQGRQADRLVLQYLDRGPARPEQQHRPEDRIVGDAHDQLIRIADSRHTLHREPVDRRIGLDQTHIHQHFLSGGPYRRRLAQIEADAADIGFVGDLG